MILISFRLFRNLLWSSFYFFFNPEEIMTTARIQFISPRRAYALIARQSDFFRRFCPADWHARGVHNLPDYLSRIQTDCLGSFSRAQSTKLEKCIARVCRQWNTDPIPLDWFDSERAALMPWNVAAVTSDAYENGFPHTLDDTIMMPVDIVDAYSCSELCRLLKHEQTHIYQRQFPADVKRFLRQNGFRRWKRHTRRDGVRANPDTDGWLYERRGERFSFPYRTRVRSLHSVDRVPGRSHPRFEHPIEWMAYLVESF